MAISLKRRKKEKTDKEVTLDCLESIKAGFELMLDEQKSDLDNGLIIIESLAHLDSVIKMVSHFTVEQ